MAGVVQILETGKSLGDIPKPVCKMFSARFCHLSTSTDTTTQSLDLSHGFHPFFPSKSDNESCRH